MNKNKKIILGIIISIIAIIGIVMVVGSFNDKPSNEEMADYIFMQFDTNNDGLLSYSELKEYEIVIGSDVSGFLDYWDMDGNNALDKHEIMLWLESEQ
ncbi:MAG: EF-hand domain-containing protein [Methanobrevibacter sp.]|nr:EF-hand domain-containing protein [Methanobrevibacter sp.]